MHRFCAVDAEGDAGSRGLVGVSFWSDARQVWVTERDDILAQLLWHARAGYTFVSHNMEYDLSVIWWQLELNVSCISYNRTFNHGDWKYAPGRRPVQLWDSLNLAAGLSLAQLGAALSLPKYPVPQQLAGIDPDRYQWQCERHGAWECIECYALRDAEIVWTYMQMLGAVVAGWGGTLTRRIGSTGMSIWKSLDRPQPIRLADRRSAYLGRRAYYGGRVECFQLGHFTGLHTADIASAYPSVMLETPFPDPRSMVTMDHLAPDRVPWEREGAAHCEVYVPPSWVPPLPNTSHGERLFAHGIQRGYWTLHELRYAMTLGVQVRKVYRATWGTESVSPFTWFVSVLWEARQAFKQDHDPRDIVVKALMNETYGRFALSESLAESVIKPCPPDARWSQHRQHRHFGAYGMLMCGTDEPKWFDRQWTNEVWAAQITAALRVKLHRLLLQQGDALVYCDTDSIFSTAPIGGLGTGLGQLSAETIYERAWIVGPKLYRLDPFQGDPIAKAKGVPPGLADQFLRGEQVWFDRPISPHQMLMGKGTAGAWITLSRERRLVPYRRLPEHPESLALEWAATRTLAPMMGAGPG